MSGRVAYIIGFGAPPVLKLHELVDLMVGHGWDCYVILSPTAASWVDVDVLAAASGHPVRVEPRKPGEPDPLPPTSAIIAAPVTFNSLNKWAQGNGDTLALGLLNESLGLGIPTTAGICAKGALRNHPAYPQSMTILVAAGVTVVETPQVIDYDDNGEPTMSWDEIAPK